MFRPPFEGYDLQKWTEHFSYSPNVAAVLQEMEVMDVRDLHYVYSDSELLNKVKKHVGTIDYKKFCDAKLYTKCLADSLSSSPSLPDPASGRPSESLPPIGDIQIQEEKPPLAPTPPEISRPSHTSTPVNRFTTTVDLAIMIDCTGSMTSYLISLKNKIMDMVQGIREMHPAIQLRLAFVGYRDHGDDERLAVLRFTTAVQDFQRIAGQQRATGGGDDAEDVLGGLSLVSKLDWNSSTRILYHIGDAPCHGKEFHDSHCSDSYPDGFMGDEKVEDILTRLRSNNVQYYFGRISTQTDQMIREFNKRAKEPSPYITVTPIDSTDMMKVIFQNVSKSVANVISKSAHTKDSGVSSDIEVPMDTSVPDWKSLKPEPFSKFEMHFPSSLEELLQEQRERCVRDFPNRDLYNAIIAQKPFSRGSLRVAYYGLLETRDGLYKPIVVKRILSKNKHLTKNHYEHFLVCHRAATFLSKQFNSCTKDIYGCPSIEFCEAHIMQCNTRWPEQPYYIYESQITDKFEKYNSNTGYCAPNPTWEKVNHDVLQAFSHWTHWVSGNRIMVVDLQGGFNAATNTFILTDPAVHSTNTSQYGRTNFGAKGFGDFYQTHKCNNYCRLLHLDSPSPMERK